MKIDINLNDWLKELAEDEPKVLGEAVFDSMHSADMIMFFNAFFEADGICLFKREVYPRLSSETKGKLLEAVESEKGEPHDPEFDEVPEQETKPTGRTYKIGDKLKFESDISKNHRRNGEIFELIAHNYIANHEPEKFTLITDEPPAAPTPQERTYKIGDKFKLVSGFYDWAGKIFTLRYYDDEGACLTVEYEGNAWPNNSENYKVKDRQHITQEEFARLSAYTNSRGEEAVFEPLT